MVLKHAAPDTWNRATTQLELKGLPGPVVFWFLCSVLTYKAKKKWKLSQHELSDNAQLHPAAPKLCLVGSRILRSHSVS